MLDLGPGRLGVDQVCGRLALLGRGDVGVRERLELELEHTFLGRESTRFDLADTFLIRLAQRLASLP